MGASHCYIPIVFLVIPLPGEPKTAKKAGTSEKDGVLSKNPGFWISQFSISALSHKVLPLMLKNQQCSYQHAASGLVSCRARDVVGKLFLHFSNAWSTTFLRRKCSDKQCQFLHTRNIHNNLNRVFANKYFTMSKRPVFSWNLSVQRPSVGLKPYYGSLRARPQKPIFVLRVPTG